MKRIILSLAVALLFGAGIVGGYSLNKSSEPLKTVNLGLVDPGGGGGYPKF